MTRAGAAVALSAGMLLACASADQVGAPDPAESDERAAVTDRSAITDRSAGTGRIAVTGRITVTGSEPHVRLVVVTDEVTYELVGDPAAELRRLQQRRVTVRGRVVREAYEPGVPARLRIDSYALERGTDG